MLADLAAQHPIWTNVATIYVAAAICFVLATVLSR